MGSAPPGSFRGRSSGQHEAVSEPAARAAKTKTKGRVGRRYAPPEVGGANFCIGQLAQAS